MYILNNNMQTQYPLLLRSKLEASLPCATQSGNQEKTDNILVTEAASSGMRQGAMAAGQPGGRARAMMAGQTSTGT